MAMLAACTAKIQTAITKAYATLDYRDEVVVLGVDEQPPPAAIEVGTLRVADSGFSIKCDYEIIINEAKLEARKVGGNVLKITQHRLPDFRSSCHRIEAKILRVENADELKKPGTVQAKTKTEVREDAPAASGEVVDTTLDYAILYVYRFGGAGSTVGYNLYLGEAPLCRVTGNSKQVVALRTEGKTTLWATAESKKEIPIDVQFGRKYYLRCGMGAGPTLELVDGRTGISEYASIKEKKK